MLEKQKAIRQKLKNKLNKIVTPEKYISINQFYPGMMVMLKMKKF